MSEEPSADGPELGPYGRRSWATEVPAASASPAPPTAGASAPPHEWWAPGVVEPSGARPAAGTVPGGPAGGASARVHSSGPWQVSDSGRVVVVSGRRASVGSLTGLGVGLVLAWMLPRFDVAPDPVSTAFFRVFGVIVVLGLLGAAVRSLRDHTALRADEHGLRIRSTWSRPGLTMVPWDDVVGFRTQTTSFTWSPRQSWFLELRDGHRLPIRPVTATWKAALPPIDGIMREVALVPTRFGRPPLLVDGSPPSSGGAASDGAAWFSHLAPASTSTSTSTWAPGAPVVAPVPVVVGPVDDQRLVVRWRRNPYYWVRDAGDRVVVRRSWRNPGWTALLAGAAFLVLSQVVFRIGGATNPTLIPFAVAALLPILAGLVVAETFLNPVLAANREGVRTGYRRTLTRWEDVERFAGSPPTASVAHERGLSAWWIQPRGRPGIRLDRGSTQNRDWQSGPTDLQRIMEALAMFPTRFGRPPVPLALAPPP